MLKVVTNSQKNVKQCILTEVALVALATLASIKAHYQAFLGVLIALIVELLGLIIKPLIIRQRAEIQYQMI